MAIAYEIVVTGRPSPMLTAAAEGFEVDAPHPGQVRLRGAVPDQAALHAVLQRLANLRIELVGVHRLTPPSAPSDPPG